MEKRRREGNIEGVENPVVTALELAVVLLPGDGRHQLECGGRLTAVVER